MDEPELLQTIFIIISTLLASAFFSGCEIAFVSANRLQIELANKQGTLAAKLLSFFYQKPSQFIGTMLVGNNISLVIYGLKMGVLLTGFIPDQYIEPNSLPELLIETTLSTILILITAEFLPKAIFSNDPNFYLQVLSPLLLPIYIILWLPTFITVKISEIFLLPFGKIKTEEGNTFGKVDLNDYVKEVLLSNDGKSNDLDTELTIFNKALDFSNTKARDCMVPRNEIVAIDVSASVNELQEKFVETHYSKILVYRKNIDNIIGYVHTYELFKEPQAIKNMLMPLFIVPESMSVQNVLKQFTQKKRGIALVVDEYGGTSGMLTIEDVIEELFGEIEDEHDTEEHIEQKISNTEYLLSGRLEIDHINEKFELELESSENFETLSGLILYHLQEIPEEGQKLTLNNHQFIIEKSEGHKIDLVRLKVLDE